MPKEADLCNCPFCERCRTIEEEILENEAMDQRAQQEAEAEAQAQQYQAEQEQAFLEQSREGDNAQGR